MRVFHQWLCAALLTIGATPVAALPPPFPPPVPVPLLWSSPVDGTWFFRGDPSKPCYVRTVAGPREPYLVFTNENGTEASGRLSRDGRRVTIPDWNLSGTVRQDALVWPNGDFWHR
jgi:hypothetical protein